MKIITNWILFIAFILLKEIFASNVCVDFGNTYLCGTNAAMFGQPCGRGCSGCETCSGSATCEMSAKPWTLGHCIDDSENAKCVKSYREFDVRVGQKPLQENLEWCGQYRSSTCCSKEYSLVLSNHAKWIQQDLSNIASEKCLELISRFICAPCHPYVGTGRITAYPCKSYCDDIYQNCLDTPFSFISLDQFSIYVPDAKGTKASEIFSNEYFFFRNSTFHFEKQTTLFYLQNCQYYYDSDPSNDLPQGICHLPTAIPPVTKSVSFISVIIGVAVTIVVIGIIIKVVQVIIIKSRKKRVGIR